MQTQGLAETLFRAHDSLQPDLTLSRLVLKQEKLACSRFVSLACALPNPALCTCFLPAWLAAITYTKRKWLLQQCSSIRFCSTLACSLLVH